MSDATKEMLDIMDEQGNKTGQVLSRADTHKQGLRHPVIHLWIYNSKGQILMQKRHPKKEVWPGAWDVAVGGHVGSGESSEEAVAKEAIEELNIQIDPTNINFIGRFKFEENMPTWVNKTFVYSYITKLDLDVSELAFEEDEVSGAEWFELDRLEKMLDDPSEAKNLSSDIREDSRIVIEDVRERLGSFS